MKNIFCYVLTVACLISLSFITSCNKDDDEIIEPTAKDERIDDVIYSEYVGDEYPMKIFLPKEYEENKNLPVVYLLDGLLSSPLDGVVFFDQVVGSIQHIGLKAILVAVGDETGVDREIDFLAQGCLGSEQGFGNFFNFITKELVPYIDSKYENNQSARTLIGFSHSGNFAYNAFFRENPDDIIFHGYIAVDPSECDPTTYEEHLNHMDFPAGTNLKIHLSQAQHDVEELYDLMLAKDFPWLTIDFKDYPDEDHVSVSVPSIRRGLDFIY